MPIYHHHEKHINIQYSGSNAIVSDLAAAFEESLDDEFATILSDSLKSMSITKDQPWSNERRRLDKRMKVVLHSLVFTFYIKWQSILYRKLWNFRLISFWNALIFNFM